MGRACLSVNGSVVSWRSSVLVTQTAATTSTLVKWCRSLTWIWRIVGFSIPSLTETMFYDDWPANISDEHSVFFHWFKRKSYHLLAKNHACEVYMTSIPRYVGWVVLKVNWPSGSPCCRGKPFKLKPNHRYHHHRHQHSHHFCYCSLIDIIEVVILVVDDVVVVVAAAPAVMLMQPCNCRNTRTFTSSVEWQINNPMITVNSSYVSGLIKGELFTLTHSVVIVLGNDCVPPLIQMDELSITYGGVSLSTGKIFKKLRTNPGKSS